MSRNRTRFITEIDDSTEAFINAFFFSIGSLSTFLSALTFYLLVKHSSFCNLEVRTFLLILQISAFLFSFHFCILFIPVLYPYLGGGFCNGLLCMLGVRFQYSMSFWLLTVILICASFIVLLFARLQTLLHPWSRLRLLFRKRLGFYVYTFLSMLIIPILFFFSDTPKDIQEQIIIDNKLDWIKDKKVYSVMNGYDKSKRVLVTFITYSILGNIIVFGSITALIFVLILHKILKSNVVQMSNHSRAVHRAKIKNSIVILAQMFMSFCLGVVPLCLKVATIGMDVEIDTEQLVVLSELCMTFLSPLNSIIFIFGNKQYVMMMKRWIQRTFSKRSKAARKQSMINIISM